MSRAGAPWRPSPAPRSRPPLTGEHVCDVCIVGGGLTGLSAAATAARSGACVILLEANRLGGGASSRSGGQVSPGFGMDATTLIAQAGEERAAELWAASRRGVARARALVTGRGGHWGAGVAALAAHARDLDDLAEEAALIAAQFGPENTEILDAAAMDARIAAAGYRHGGAWHGGAGWVEPSALVDAVIAEAEGAALHEGSPVTAIRADGVETGQARVSASAVIVARNALPLGPQRRADAAVFPIWGYAGVTAPDPERLAALTPLGAAAYDTRVVTSYFRPTVDGRLAFGGGESWTPWPAREPERGLRRALRRSLPDWADAVFETVWAGPIGVTRNRAPAVGREDGVWYAQGYSGHGLALSLVLGEALAAAAGGDETALAPFMALKTKAFPGPRRLRGPIQFAAMAGLAAMDRLRDLRE